MNHIIQDYRAEVDAAIAKAERARRHAQENCDEEILAAELKRVARMNATMAAFEGKSPTTEAIVAEPPVLDLAATKPRLAELLNDDAGASPFPRAVTGPRGATGA